MRLYYLVVYFISPSSHLGQVKCLQVSCDRGDGLVYFPFGLLQKTQSMQSHIAGHSAVWCENLFVLKSFMQGIERFLLKVQQRDIEKDQAISCLAWSSWDTTSMNVTCSWLEEHNFGWQGELTPELDERATFLTNLERLDALSFTVILAKCKTLERPPSSTDTKATKSHKKSVFRIQRVS